MTAILHKLSPAEVRARLDAGRAVLVDIREPDEFARARIKGAQSQPLSKWEQAHLAIDPDADVVFTCRSGMRTDSMGRDSVVVYFPSITMPEGFVEEDEDSD
jgi:rhodanese-related sulfurtransferase